MEKHKDPKRRFLPLYARHEPIYLDSSAISTFKKCARLYFYQYVLAKVPQKTNWPLIFGSAYHKFREVLSTSYFTHLQCNGTIDDFSDANLLHAIKVTIAHYDKESKNTEPAEDDKWSFLSKARLILTCKVAYGYWRNEVKKGDIKVLEVELPGNYLYSNGQRKTFRVDELVKWQGEYYIRDFKASSVRPEYYKYNLRFKDQPYTYIVGIRKTSGQDIKGILYEQMYNAKGTKTKMEGPEIHTHMISYTPSQLENWEFEQSFIHEQISRARELDIYPMREDEYTCPHCDYRDLCIANNQNQMYSIIESKFKTHIWDNSNV